MAPSLLRASTRPDLYVCARCAFRTSKVSSKITRRWIGMKYLAKVAEAEVAWAEKASKTRSGEEKSMLTILEDRGLVQTVTGTRKEVDRLMTEKRLGAYVGIDPTASSLHVGHMIPLMSLFWMYVHGYHTVSLLGGATAKIGDPTDRLKSREKQHSSVGTANMTTMHYQLRELWKNVESYGTKYGYKWEWSWHRELINNNAWWNKLPMLEVLQILGPGMRMGSMLARDTVKNKMRHGDGMSFAEFTYPVMQAWDWWYMFHTKGINMQIGGADQFGNITAGIDAVKHISTHHPDPVVREQALAVGEPFGFTVPLLTTSSGQKFGKSAGNAIWLDKEQTSSFELYKYFLGTADADVEKYLRMFTFMPLEDISALVEEHTKSPHLRTAQHKLASEFTELIHGAEEAKLVETQHRLLFKNPAAVLFPGPESLGTETEVMPQPKSNFKVTVKLPRYVVYQKSIAKILLAVGLASTSSDAHRLVAAGGAYVGGSTTAASGPKIDGFVSWSKVKAWEPSETRKYIIHDDLLLFRRGKDQIRIVKIVPDNEYAVSGETYPGMAREWRMGVLKAIQIEKALSRAEQQNIEKLLSEDESFLRNQNEEFAKAAEAKKTGKSKLSEKQKQMPTPPNSSEMLEEVSTPSNNFETLEKASTLSPREKAILDFVKKAKSVEGADKAS